MKTYLYMVRHAKSPFYANAEETRGLSAEGEQDARTVADILSGVDVAAIYSSPYRRAVQTVEEIARQRKMEIILEHDLRERDLAAPDYVFDDFQAAIQAVFDNPSFAHPGGESNEAARKRAIGVLLRILQKHTGKHVVIGTHGNILTIMLQHFDPKYGLSFWKQTTSPDLYQLVFEADRLVTVNRLWNPIAANSLD